MRQRIRVLIVDDSAVFRQLLIRAFAAAPDIDVVAAAADPFEARDKLLEHHPDVMVCDVHMPRMNGIEFLRKLLPQYPLPVIVTSTCSSAVFDAMNAGAVDFIPKPDGGPSGMERFVDGLAEKIRIASRARILRPGGPSAGVTAAGAARRPAFPAGASPVRQAPKLIAIGASTGGPEAIFTLLRGLPADAPGIVIVQHIPARFSRMFAERLNQTLELRVKEAETGDAAERGTVLIAPGDRHMRVKRKDGKFTVECFHGEKVNRHCPSIDVLFESVAREAGNRAIGVILTGMGYDGAKGLLAMRRKGARTIGQDEASSVVYGMPKVAWELGAVEKQCSLHDMPRVITGLL